MKYINFDMINDLNITPLQCLDWVKEALLHKYDSILPPKTSIKFNDGCFFNTMPSLLPNLNRFGVKVVSRYPVLSNKETPSLSADIMLYDSSNGDLLSIMDGTWITSMRTGAVAALSINLLQKKETKSYSFIGLGNTARATLLCLDAITNQKSLAIKILSYKDQHISFMNRFSTYKNFNFKVYDKTSELIKSSDVVISSVTTAKNNMASDEYFPEGISVVPIHTMGFQNCDLFFDKVFCDDIGHIKDFKYFNKLKHCEEMAKLWSNNTPGRETEKERILIYNIGISIQDIFFATKICDLVSVIPPHTHTVHIFAPSAVLGIKVYITQENYVMNTESQSSSLPQDTLIQLHSVLLEIMDEFVRICRENNLTYFLEGGTLLGAVRHKGFIPWDDDVDVAMPRSDFEKFINIYHKINSTDYYLLSHRSPVDTFFHYLPLAKLCKKDTIIAESYRKPIDYSGIFIDIFPIDNSIKFFAPMQKIIISKLKKLYKMKTKRIIPKRRIKRFIINVICFFAPVVLLRFIMSKVYTVLNNFSTKYISFFSGYSPIQRVTHEVNTIFPLTELEFSGKKYCVPGNWNSFLIQRYGDYMKLPALGERKTHKPLFILFENAGIYEPAWIKQGTNYP